MTPDKRVEKRRYPQEMRLMGSCPHCEAEINGAFVEATIDDILTQYHQDLMREVEKDYYIGQTLNVYGAEHIVVGISTMVYDEDCEGEPEWKITDKIQEVAIAIKYDETSYQKPCWLKVSALENALTEAQTIIKSK